MARLCGSAITGEGRTVSPRQFYSTGTAVNVAVTRHLGTVTVFLKISTVPSEYSGKYIDQLIDYT